MYLDYHKYLPQSTCRIELVGKPGEDMEEPRIRAGDTAVTLC